MTGLRDTGPWEQALAECRAALAVDPGDLERCCDLGSLLLALGRTEEAVAAYRDALAAGFDHPQAFYNLGTALRRLGRSAEAVEAFRAALIRDPDFAPAHNNCGNALRDLGRHADAAEAYLAALALRPGDGGARVNLASALSLLYERDPGLARALAERWRTAHPGCAIAGHVGAAMVGGPAPERAADAYVRNLFDGFAADFERRLAGLDYRVPALIAAALAETPPGADLAVLDAGCGTGLLAPILRPRAATLTGVNLSPGMLERARGRGLYDHLVEAELTGFLAERPGTVNLIVAADVLCYFGALLPVLTAARRALRPAGRLLFTVEIATPVDPNPVDPIPEPAAEPPPFTLQANGRYRHSRTGVAAALTGAGLTAPSPVPVTLRREGLNPVPGLLIEARAVGSVAQASA